MLLLCCASAHAQQCESMYAEILKQSGIIDVALSKLEERSTLLPERDAQKIFSRITLDSLVCDLTPFVDEYVDDNEAARINLFLQSDDGQTWASAVKQELDIDDVPLSVLSNINTFLQSRAGQVYSQMSDAVNNEIICLLLSELNQLGYDTNRRKARLIAEGIDEKAAQQQQCGF